MNQSPFITVFACAAIAQLTIGAEPTNEPNRKRPRKEINRVEPPGTSESQPGKKTAVEAELCNESGDVKYSAAWQKGRVTLAASGSHTTGGYRTFFEQSMLMIYPPEFSLKHQRPSGPATQAITPFSVQTSFKADEKPQAITVHDAKGRQRVPVR
jgi:hypothetical protein